MDWIEGKTVKRKSRESSAHISNSTSIPPSLVERKV